MALNPTVSNLSTQSITIANGASLSSAIDLQGTSVVAIQMPSAWTAANLTFQGSNDDSTFDNLYDSSGTEVQVTAAASRYIAITPTNFQGVRYLKIRSGTSGSAVNQAADRVLVLVSKPIL